MSDSHYNEQLADQITTLAGQINAANYRFLKLIAEFDRLQAWALPGVRSCAHWLNWKCGIAMSAAREKVRTARALAKLPKINAAFEKGELSYSKARAMTRVASEDNEEYLLMIADHGTAQHMETLVKSYRTVSRHEDACYEANSHKAGSDIHLDSLDEFGRTKEQREQQKIQLSYDTRQLNFYQGDDGAWIIKAKLPEEEGGLLVKLLKTLGEQLAGNFLEKQSTEKQSAENREVENREVENKQQEERLKGVSAETPSFSQRRADALVALAEHYLASENLGSKSQSKPLDKPRALKASERCQLVLHVHSGDQALASAQADNLDGRWLLPSAARRLACDTSLLLVRQDSAGNVLDIGRKSRIIPAAMARALAIRDGGCQFPGCCEKHYVEGHHIKHWADGGETKLDNLVTLCRFHHRELHKGHYFLSLKPTSKTAPRFADRLCFSTVDPYYQSTLGRHNNYEVSRNPAKFTCACHGFEVFENELKARLDNPINAQTAVTRWTGERMDLGMTVEGLWNASHTRNVDGTIIRHNNSAL